MTPTFWLYAFSLSVMVFASLLSLALAVYLARQHQTLGVKPVLMLLAGMAIWSAGCAARLASDTVAGKVFWENVNFIGIVLIPAGWLLFVLQYTRFVPRLSPAWVALLAVEPVLVHLVLWTDRLHGLFRSQVNLAGEGLLSYLVVTPGPFFWVHIVYSHLVILIGIGLFLRYSFAIPPGYRRQSAALMCSLSVAFVINVLDVQRLHPFRWIDLTPLGFILMGASLVLILRNYWLFDLTPVARNTILESLEDPVFVFDLSDRLVDVNRAAAELVGDTAARLIGEPARQVLTFSPVLWADFVEDTARDNLERPVIRGEFDLSGSQPDHGETRRTFEYRIEQLRDPIWVASGRIIMLHEITEWRNAEETLREREARLRLAMNQAPAILWSTDRELRFTSMMGSGLTRLGIQPEQVEGVFVTDIYPPGATEKPILEGHLRALQGETVSYEAALDGRVYQSYIEPFHNTEGEIIGALGVTIDITDLKKAESAVQAGEDKLRQMVDNSPNAIFAVDSAGNILSFNQAYRALFQYGPDLVGQSFHQILADPDQRQQLDPLVKRVFSEKLTVKEIEVTYRSSDRQERCMASRLYPLVGPDGEVEACIFANTDITERKQSEETLRRQLQELTVLHAVSTACVEAQDEDTLIERVTQVIGSNLYTHNFGVLLVDDSQDRLRFHPSYHGLPAGYQTVEITHGQAVASQVARTGIARRVSDGEQNAHSLHLHESARSEMCVPLKVSGRVIGVINVESQRPDAFSESDERLLSVVAGQIATSIERLRSSAAERQRAEELLAITGVSREISSRLEWKHVLNTIVRHAAELSGSDACGVYSIQRTGIFRLEAAYGVSDQFKNHLLQTGIPMEGSAVGKAVTLRKPIQIVDLKNDPTYRLQMLVEMEGMRSILALPLLRGDEVLGGIVVWRRKLHHYSTEEIAFLEALAQQSVNAMINARRFEAEREQRLLAESLREVGSALSASLDLDTILDHLLGQAARVIPIDFANIMLVENGTAKIARTLNSDQFPPDVVRTVSNLQLEIETTENLRELCNRRGPVVIDDVMDYPGWLKVGVGGWIRSWVGAPVIEQDRVVAIFSLAKLEPDFYTQEHADRLGVIAGQAGLALQNARLYEETRRRLREVTLLSQVITLTASASDMTAALNQICREIGLYFESTAVPFGLLDDDGKAVEIVAEYTAPGEASTLGVRFPIEPGSGPAQLLEREAPLGISDFENEPLLGSLREILRQFGITSLMILPIRIHEEVVGAFAIESAERRDFSPAEKELMHHIARQVGQALELLKLFTSSREQARQMSALASLGGDLTRNLTEDEVLNGIGRGAKILSQSDRVAIYLPEPDGGVTCRWREGISEAYVREVSRRYAEMPGGQHLHETVPLLINDIQDEKISEFVRRLAEKEGFRSLGLWPLEYEGKSKGLVGCYFDTSHFWSEDDRETMLAFARQASVALENARLFDETRRRAKQQEALNAIITAVVDSSDLNSLLEEVLDLSMQALQGTWGGVWVMDKLVVRGATPEALRSGDGHFPTKVLPTAPVAVDDWEQIGEDGELAQYRAFMEELEVRASLTVPVMDGGSVIGELSLAEPGPRVWSADDVALLEVVGRQLGSAVLRLNLLAKTQEQARQMQQIIDTVPEGVLLLNNERQVVLANPAALQALALLANNPDLDKPLNWLAGMRVEELLAAPAESAWQEISSEGVRGAGPARRIFECAARPLGAVSDTDPFAAQGWVLVLRDVTLERESQMRIQMHERLATVGQLAAGIAHDFNNIMAAIVVYSDLLEMDPKIEQPSRDRLAIIQKQVDRAASLIRQILDFSRRSVMEQSSLDLLPFIKELDKLLGRVLPETIRLELDYRPDVYQVKADPTRLQQVFMNLALNARDAMPNGGTLSFRLDRITFGPNDPAPTPELQPGIWVRIQVEDTGSGISPDVMPYIFDPFFTTKPVGQGTGLGLAQVYGIVQAHGGVITVDSQPGKGSKFSIYLPGLRLVRERAEPLRVGEGPLGNGETILVAEDDAVARDAMQALLESQNYQVLAAANGVEALRIYLQRGDTIAAVVSDIVMPEMGGLELYETLCRRDPDVKMLLVTGHPLEGRNQELLEAGQVSWLQKPFSVKTLSDALHKLLHNGAPTAS